MPKAMSGAELLCATDVWKTFDRTRALAGAEFELAAGEVHALVGANGAGKSTFSRILSGHVCADRGEILLNGEAVRFTSSRDAIRSGVAIVMQETSLVPDLSVLENIFLPELGMPGRLSLKKLAGQAETLLRELGQHRQLPLGETVRNLSIGQRQLIEIAKALALDSKIMIFDEPTASLSPHEVERLFDVIRTLSARGKGLIFVSHRLEEIFAIADRVTVFREGKSVGRSIPTERISPAELVRLMVGRELTDIYARETVQGAEAASRKRDPILDVMHLASRPRVRDVSLSVAAGEIVGLAGLVGAGRSEAAETMFGLRRMDGGSMRFAGAPFKPRVPADAIRAGLGFIAEDRRGQGLVPDFSVRENLMLASLGQHRGMGTGYERRASEARRILEELGLPAEQVLEANILSLSGGMQQKVILARWLVLHPRLLILDEPTKGVDIGTRSGIYALLRKIAGQGVGVLVISSDFEEVLGLADRVVIMADGAVVTDIPTALLDVEKLTMFAAPKTSAERTHLTLTRLVGEVGGYAYWIYVERERLYCFDAAGDNERFDPGFERGGFPLLTETRVAGALAHGAGVFVNEHDNGHATMLLPIESSRGHDLGYIGIVLSAEQAAVDGARIRRIVSETMGAKEDLLTTS